eukprot:Skav205889  [mRNA]  locus=scaffold123:79548:86889:+ [translate_table: standard]
MTLLAPSCSSRRARLAVRMDSLAHRRMEMDSMSSCMLQFLLAITIAAMSISVLTSTGVISRCLTCANGEYGGCAAAQLRLGSVGTNSVWVWPVRMAAAQCSVVTGNWSVEVWLAGQRQGSRTFHVYTSSGLPAVPWSSYFAVVKTDEIAGPFDLPEFRVELKNKVSAD